MEALFNLYYFCLFVTKNHVFVLYFLSGEEVGGNARDNRGTGAAMQCRRSAAAPGTGAARAACLGRDLSSALASIARRRSRRSFSGSAASPLGRPGPSSPSRPLERFPGTMKLGKQEEEKEGAASSFLDCSEDDSRSSAAVFDIVATTE